MLGAGSKLVLVILPLITRISHLVGILLYTNILKAINLLSRTKVRSRKDNLLTFEIIFFWFYFQYYGGTTIEVSWILINIDLYLYWLDQKPGTEV